MDQLITTYVLQPQGICPKPRGVTPLMVTLNLSVPHKAHWSRIHSFFITICFFTYTCGSLSWIFQSSLFRVALDSVY